MPWHSSNELFTISLKYKDTESISYYYYLLKIKWKQRRETQLAWSDYWRSNGNLLTITSNWDNSLAMLFIALYQCTCNLRSILLMTFVFYLWHVWQAVRLSVFLIQLFFILNVMSYTFTPPYVIKIYYINFIFDCLCYCFLLIYEMIFMMSFYASHSVFYV